MALEQAISTEKADSLRKPALQRDTDDETVKAGNLRMPSLARDRSTTGLEEILETERVDNL